MAVLIEPQARLDSVAKHNNSHSHGRRDYLRKEKMSFPVPPLPTGANSNHGLSLNATSESEDKFTVPQGAIDREALKKRKAAKSKPSDLRRSASTPHLGKPGQADAGLTSPENDKKRNKLGYHRSSIACSHCRRRKIRCQIPIPDDPQGRCTNCIRLKKECNFYPVDQAPPADGRASLPGKKDSTVSGAPSVSSQSSPHISGASQSASVADEVQMQLQSPGLEFEVQQQREGRGYSLSAVSDIHSRNLPYEFNQQQPVGGVWTDAQHPIESYPQQHRASIATEPQYWSASNIPITPHFSHESSSSYHQSTPPSFNPNFAFTQPSTSGLTSARAMSFGNLESIPQSYPYPPAQYGHGDGQSPYTIPPHQVYAHNSVPHHQQLPSQGTANQPDTMHKAWSNPGPVTNQLVSASPYVHNLQNQYYVPAQSPVDGYDSRAGPTHQQGAQYYPASTHPG